MVCFNTNDPTLGTVSEWQAWARRNTDRPGRVPNAYTAARRYAAEHGQAIVMGADDSAAVYTLERGACRYGVVRVRQYPAEQVRWLGRPRHFTPQYALWALWNHEDARTLGTV